MKPPTHEQHPDRQLDVLGLGASVFDAFKQHAWLFSSGEFEVVFLRLNMGLTNRDAAARLEIAESTASERFQRARRRLKDYLAEVRRDSLRELRASE